VLTSPALGSQQPDRGASLSPQRVPHARIATRETVELHERRTLDDTDRRGCPRLDEMRYVHLSGAFTHASGEWIAAQLAVRGDESFPAHLPARARRELEQLDRQPGGYLAGKALGIAGTEHVRVDSVGLETAKQANQTSCGRSALRDGGNRRDNQDAQGCDSMTHMLSTARALPRRLLHGGAPGDAGSAGGRQIASNIVVQLGARVITMAISVVTVSLTARTLHPSGFGVWNGISSYVGLFATLTDLGFTTAAMQRMAAEPEKESQWLGALAGARTALSFVALVLCAISIPIFLGDAHQEQLVAFVMMSTILTTGATALMAVFQSRLRAGLILSISVVQAFVWLGTVLVLAAGGASVVIFAAANALVVGGVAITQLQVTRKYAHIAWREGRRLWKPLIRVALPLGLASVMTTIYWQVDSVLLLQISGPTESGIYGAAYGFLSPLTFLPAAVMSSFFPVLSAVYGRDPARSRRLVQICADSMAVIALPILAGTIALSEEIIHLMYGSSFARSAGLLPILMIAFVSICFGSLSGFLAPVLGLQWRLALYATLGAAANVVMNLLLIPSYGAYGSAWATVATEVLTMTLMLSTALYKMKAQLSPLKIMRTVVLATVMTGVMFVAKPLGLFPAGILGVLFYAGGLFAARIVNVAELRSLRAERA
jgi:O-antigen/teichoic acid export membrane protein